MPVGPRPPYGRPGGASVTAPRRLNGDIGGHYAGLMETATIRVPRETRDLLAEQAQSRGASLSSMLTGLARDTAREAMFRAEREASRRDASSRDVAAEERAWDTTLDDGIE